MIEYQKIIRRVVEKRKVAKMETVQEIEKQKNI